MRLISWLEELYYSGRIDRKDYYRYYNIKDDLDTVKKIFEKNDIAYKTDTDKYFLDFTRINKKYMNIDYYKLYKENGFIIIDVVENNIILGITDKFNEDIILENYEEYRSVKCMYIGFESYNLILSNILRQAKELEISSVTKIPKFVDEMIKDAVSSKASDIHIEPMKEYINIRFRINGELNIYKKIAKEYIQEISSKLKIMSNLNIAEKRDIQDGEFTFNIEKKIYNFRISIVPTVYGEKIAIRILDKIDNRLDVGNLHLGYHLKDFRDLIYRKSGLLLVTGPTGCGKTTTLYSILNELKSASNNIMTVEDPVEYKLDGINQIQVNNNIGFDFDKGLKAVLRQDPEIVMIGEIRDRETAINATRAAITGHLVLSTLHTNKAIDVIDRLKDIGVEPYMIASALIGVISQRLVKLLCPICKEEYNSKTYENKILGIDNTIKLYRRKGCDRCQNGYIGRRGVYEVLVIDEAFKNSIRMELELKKIFMDRVYGKKLYFIRDQCIDLVKKGLIEFDEIYSIGV